jgi:hypothetical protein
VAAKLATTSDGEEAPKSFVADTAQKTSARRFALCAAESDIISEVIHNGSLAIRPAYYDLDSGSVRWLGKTPS